MIEILYIGVAVFAASTVLFYLFSPKKFNPAFLVSFITLVSYLIMLEGSFVTLNSDNEEIYWTRWVGYAFSCTLLIYTIGKYLKLDWSKIVEMLYLTAGVMLTGALASYFENEFMWAFFAVSSFAYVALIYPILTAKEKTRSEFVTFFIVFGWSIFPIVFILSHEGLGYIENVIAFAIYLGLDLFTKIFFYMFLEDSK